MGEFTYRLAVDGDIFEQHCWNLFIKDQFPSYEKFWLRFIVSLTNRPKNIHFKTDEKLAEINKTTLDICIAQLNYSILRHLMRCFEILKILKTSAGADQQLNLLQEGMARLIGAQDNAFELLERFNNPKRYQPFEEKTGKKAREKMYDKKRKGYPLQHIRDYRNSLMHGRILPGIMNGQRLCLPNIKKVELYLDWRLITELSSEREKYKKDFISVLNILECAWKETIDYLENNWKNL